MENFSEKIQSLRNEYSDLDLTSEDLNQVIAQGQYWNHGHKLHRSHYNAS